MTEGFARVNEMFHEARNHVLMDGRSPYLVLFGPEEFAAWTDMLNNYPHTVKDPSLVGTESRFWGIVVRRMSHPGVAIKSTRLHIIGVDWGKGFGPPPKGFF